MVVSETLVSESEKRACLDAVLGSKAFARSAQLKALLRYLCEKELAGDTEALTEYRIAVEVLGRRKDEDFSDDATVRNRAYELRQRLERYYATEHPDAPIRIEIPRGGYVPVYTRHAAPHTPAAPAEPAQAPKPLRANRWLTVGLPVVCAIAGIVAGIGLRSATVAQPAAILREAWGPLADPSGDLLLVIATNMHMIVRPHIAQHNRRLPAPDSVYPLYGSRPLASGEPLFMEPAQLSVPLGELSAAVTLANMRAAFGGGYQILPEAEAPVAALRGRNSVLIGSGTNSQAATVLLKNLPFTIDYNAQNQFAVFDQRKPPAQNQLYVSQPNGEPVPSSVYGLISVLTTTASGGATRRTVVFSGSGSAGVQGAVEFFSSPDRMKEMRTRFLAEKRVAFPPSYQVVVRCQTSGVRLISYQYVAHAIVDQP